MNYKQIGGGALGATILTILIMLNSPITDNTYICTSTNLTCEADYGISGGQHTRCYETQEQKDNWRLGEYCSNGWLRIKDYVTDETPDDYPDQKLNNGRWVCNPRECIKQ